MNVMPVGTEGYIRTENSGFEYLNVNLEYEKNEEGEVLELTAEKLYVNVKKISYGYNFKPHFRSVTKNTWKELKKELKELYKELVEFVKEVISNQAKDFRKRIQGLLEDYFSPEKTAERILNFAKSISGGDPSKIELLRNAVEKGFKEVEKIFGKLPEISRKTYELVMKGFDDWKSETVEVVNYTNTVYFESVQLVYEKLEIEFTASLDKVA